MFPRAESNRPENRLGLVFCWQKFIAMFFKNLVYRTLNVISFATEA